LLRRDGYRRCSIASIVTVLAVAGFGAAAAMPASAELTATSSCTTTAVTSLTGETIFGPEEADVDVTIDADAIPQNGITLTNTTATITFDGSLVQTAVDVGLITDGDIFPGSMDLEIAAANTVEVSQTANADAEVVVDIVGGIAQPLTATFELSDTSWTSVEPTLPVAFRQASTAIMAEIDVLGGVVLEADCAPNGSDPFLTLEASGLPSAPTGLVVEPDDGRVALTWNAPSDDGGGILQYRIAVFNSTGGAPTGVTGAATRYVSPASTTMSFTGLQNGVAYTFRVAGETFAGTGESAVSTATTPRPRVSIGDASTFEGNAGGRGLRFTVSLSAVSTKTVTVKYKTTSGTAKSTSDFTAKSGTATIAAGKASVETSISVRGDLTGEATESFTMTLSAPTNAALRRAVGTGKILNDDPGPQSRRVSIGDASVDEGRTGTRSVRLTVSLSAVSTKKTTVKFATANWSAVNTSDYTKTSGTITIPAGSVSAIISVPVRGDTTKESSEGFKVTLSTPTGAALGRSSATATIINDD
jgi:hypothetical protein